MSQFIAIEKDGSRKPLQINPNPLGRGGEGCVYEIHGSEFSNFCLKVYHESYRTHEKAHKIRYMMQYFGNSSHPQAQLCWPYAEVRDDSLHYTKNFVGFIMPKAHDHSQELQRLTTYALSNRLSCDWHKFFHPDSACDLRMKICLNFCIAVHLLHQKSRYTFVDLKPHNIMITSDGKLSVVDLDSIQIKSSSGRYFFARVSTPEYTPPESMDVAVKNTLVDVEWDRFSMAVILYQIMFGVHPFSASFKPPYDNSNTLHDNIENRLFVHGDKASFIKTMAKPHYKFFSIHQDIKKLFMQAFNETSRPSIEAWERFYKGTL